MLLGLGIPRVETEHRGQDTCGSFQQQQLLCRVLLFGLCNSILLKVWFFDPHLNPFFTKSKTLSNSR